MKNRIIKSMRISLLSRVIGTLFLVSVIIILTRSHEASALQEFNNSKQKIIFEYGELTFEYSLQELGLNRIGKCEATNLSGDLIICKDPALLSYKLYCLARKVEKLPVDAGMFINESGNIEIMPGQEGYTLDLASLITELGNTGIYRERYQLPIKKLLPNITAGHLEERMPDTLWAQYSTMLADIPDRTENIRIASLELDCLLIKPNEEVSFNEIVGPRDSDRGYREAKIIIDGNYESGLGGGICQVSSTLYNTLLSAGLKIKERHNHSVQISYVPLGQDATVVYGYKDLVFLNNTDSFLLLRTSLEGLKLTISLFGSSIRTAEQIDIYTKIIKKISFADIKIIDESLEPGTKKLIKSGQNGYLTETYRRYSTTNGSIEELISRDYYKAQSSKTAVAP